MASSAVATYAVGIAVDGGETILWNGMGRKIETVTLNMYAALWPDRPDDVADALEADRATSLMLSNVVCDETDRE